MKTRSSKSLVWLKRFLPLLLCILNLPPSTAFAQGTAITYQGRLNSSGGPANGSYDLTFALFNGASGGGQVGGVLTSTATGVSNGLFTVTLDFGDEFPGAERWLEIGVRTNGGGKFTALEPRQQITSAPYAVRAANAATAASASSVAATNITGTLTTSQLPTSLVTNVALRAGGNTFSDYQIVSNGTAFYYGGVAVRPANPGWAAVTEYDGTNNTSGFRAFVGADGIGITGTPNQMYLGTYSPHPMGFFTDRYQRMTISAAGNVGIGTASPSPAAKLDVNGNVAIEGNNTLQFGAGLAGQEPNAGKIGYEIFTPGALEIVGAGTNGPSRRIQFWAEGGSTFAGGINANGPVNVNSPGSSGVTAILRAGPFDTWPFAVQDNFGNNLLLMDVGGSTTFNGPVSAASVSAASMSATSFAGDGAGLTNLVNAWQVDGNSGTIGYVHFLGTTDNEPLNLRVNNTRGLELRYTTDGSLNYINVTAGWGDNYCLSPGGTIAGGGANGWPNTIYYNSPVSTIGGGLYNSVNSGSIGVVIAGGVINRVGTNSQETVMGGGLQNWVFDNSAYSVIAGGRNNLLGGGAVSGTISGGANNKIGLNATYCSVGGGSYNEVLSNSFLSTIGGGVSNIVGGNYSTVPGGNRNSATGTASFAAGYRGKAVHNGAFVWADATEADFSSTTTNQFNVRAGGGVRFQTGSAGLTVNGNPVLAGSVPDTNLSSNVALRNSGNTFTGNQTFTGGSAVFTNGIVTMHSPLFAFGNVSIGNFVIAPSPYPLGFDTSLGDKICLFNNSPISKTNHFGFGIQNNQLQIHADFASSDIVFGYGTSTNLTEKMRIKGSGNVGIGTTAPGRLLQIGSTTNQADATIRLACGNGGFLRTWDIGVPYGGGSVSGSNYSFVIQDATAVGSPTRFMIDYNSGNVCIGTTTPLSGGLLTVLNAKCDGSSWINASDRNLKEGFAPVNPESILEQVVSLPVRSWYYKSRPDEKHIGPVAQDFHAAFGLNGADDKHIATVDESGVALAAIQGLNAKVESGKQKAERRVATLEHRLQQREGEIRDLRTQVNELRELIETINHKLNGGTK